MKAEEHQRIREVIGRELDASELETFESLDEISAPVAAMTVRIANPDLILASKYLRERVVRHTSLGLVTVKLDALLQEHERSKKGPG